MSNENVVMDQNLPADNAGGDENGVQKPRKSLVAGKSRKDRFLESRPKGTGRRTTARSIGGSAKTSNAERKEADGTFSSGSSSEGDDDEAEQLESPATTSTTATTVVSEEGVADGDKKERKSLVAGASRRDRFLDSRPKGTGRVATNRSIGVGAKYVYLKYVLIFPSFVVRSLMCVVFVSFLSFLLCSLTPSRFPLACHRLPLAPSLPLPSSLSTHLVGL